MEEILHPHDPTTDTGRLVLSKPEWDNRIPRSSCCMSSPWRLTSVGGMPSGLTHSMIMLVIL